ncbi:hypothetical protein DCC62_23985 [candidate division KSB1 bacterium]|nr:MAG: hypothetical protein DCC62_23985 [candidate division KSB1 bacterium]
MAQKHAFVDTACWVAILSKSDQLHRSAKNVYEKYTDKKWSLTDCISMTVMKERSLVETLTHDEHFRQASFKILL